MHGNVAGSIFSYSLLIPHRIYAACQKWYTCGHVSYTGMWPGCWRRPEVVFVWLLQAVGLGAPFVCSLRLCNHETLETSLSSQTTTPEAWATW
jgi:hypothetical protein